MPKDSYPNVSPYFFRNIGRSKLKIGEIAELGEVLLVFFLVSVTLTHYSPRAQGIGVNLVQNGDFNQALEPYWKIVRLQIRGPHPIVRIETDRSGNRYLSMDTPLNSWAYVEQEIDVPEGLAAVFTLTVWGSVAETDTRVEVLDSEGRRLFIDSFDPGGKRDLGGFPLTRTYEINNILGMKIRLRLHSRGYSNEGVFSFFDDIKLLVAAGKNSLITCAYSGPEGFPFPISTGQQVELSGRIIPSTGRREIVDMRLVRPDGRIIPSLRTVTSARGEFSSKFEPDQEGIWTFTAYWGGAETLTEAESPRCDFGVVRPGVFPGRLEIAGLPLINNEIQSRPNETIQGFLSLTVKEPLRLTNVVWVGFNTWEPNAWDLLLVQVGIVHLRTQNEAMGTKLLYRIRDNTFREESIVFHPRAGGYSTNATWLFGQQSAAPNDLVGIGPGGPVALVKEHPSFKAPSKEGTFYLVVIQASVSNSRVLLNKVTFFGQSYETVWQVPSDVWSKMQHKSRENLGSFNILAVPVIVVDVDPIINKVAKEIEAAEKIGLDISNLRAKLSQAVQAYEIRDYLSAKKIALEIRSEYQNLLKNYCQQVSTQASSLQSALRFGQFLADVSREERLLRSASSLLAERDCISAAELVTGASTKLTGTFLIVFFYFFLVVAVSGYAHRFIDVLGMKDVTKRYASKIAVIGVLATMGFVTTLQIPTVVLAVLLFVFGPRYFPRIPWAVELMKRRVKFSVTATLAVGIVVGSAYAYLNVPELVELMRFVGSVAGIVTFLYWIESRMRKGSGSKKSQNSGDHV